MTCPKCGSKTTARQQYCRSCGTELESAPPSAINYQAWGLVVLMMIFGGLLIAMGGKLWATKWVVFLGLLITFGGMFAIAAYGLLRQMSPRRPKRVVESDSPTETEPALRADTTNKLLPIGENDFIPSVVDDTTDLLKVPASRDPEKLSQ